MTIDEAIAHAREVAEEQRRDYDDCLTKDKYGCKDCAYHHSQTCFECAEEHEQLAQWLEELKVIKDGAVFYSNRPIEDIVLETRADAIKELLMPYDVESIEELIENVRNKADKEHKEMCNSCIHKVSKEDIDAIRADAIEECKTLANSRYWVTMPQLIMAMEQLKQK